MTTLTSPPVKTLLDGLFADAEITRKAFMAELEKYSPAEREAMLTSKDYKEFYTRAKDVHLPVSRETGNLLYMLARSTGARSVVEFGTSFGISTLHLAAALRDNGGGRLIGTEFETSKIARARATIAAAGFSDLVEIREGDALETLSRNLPDVIDLVLLDGAKGLYPDVLALLEPRLRRGAFIVADNANWSPEYLSRVRMAGGDYLSVPFPDDVELSMRVGPANQFRVQPHGFTEPRR
jgi:predicted O-methyltransferase YrrM